MDNDQEVLDFLEHFGVKGMKWGVRKKSTSESSGESKPPSRKKQFVKGAAIGAGIAVAAVIIANVGARKISTISANMGQSKRLSDLTKVSDLINSERAVKIDAIIKTHKEGFISKEQMDNFVSTMQKRYDRKIAEAARDIVS